MHNYAQTNPHSKHKYFCLWLFISGELSNLSGLCWASQLSRARCGQRVTALGHPRSHFSHAAIEEGSFLLTKHFCIEKCRFGSKESILQVYSNYTEILWLPPSLENIHNLFILQPSFLRAATPRPQGWGWVHVDSQCWDVTLPGDVCPSRKAISRWLLPLPTFSYLNCTAELQEASRTGILKDAASSGTSQRGCL